MSASTLGGAADARLSAGPAARRPLGPGGEPADALDCRPAALAAWSTPWKLADIPKLRPSERSLVELDGQRVLQIKADAAAGGLVHPLSLPGEQAWQLSWQWRTEQKLDKARFATREGDDYAARVYVLLDYPLDSLSFVTRQKLRLARTFFDPDLPAATLSYVWDNREAPGTPCAQRLHRNGRDARAARPGSALGRVAGGVA